MSLMLRKEEALRDIWWHLHKNKLVHKPQAIEKVITRANNPPTPPTPPHPVNGKLIYHKVTQNSLPFVFINTPGAYE